MKYHVLSGTPMVNRKMVKATCSIIQAIHTISSPSKNKMYLYSTDLYAMPTKKHSYLSEVILHYCCPYNRNCKIL